jgi:hypothetical protein
MLWVQTCGRTTAPLSGKFQVNLKRHTASVRDDVSTDRMLMLLLLLAAVSAATVTVHR